MAALELTAADYRGAGRATHSAEDRHPLRLPLVPIARPCVRHEVHLPIRLRASTGFGNTRYCLHGGSAKGGPPSPFERENQRIAQPFRPEALAVCRTERP
jgi:hypothetical protein